MIDNALLHKRGVSLTPSIHPLLPVSEHHADGDAQSVEVEAALTNG